MGEMNERQSDFAWLQQFARAGNQNAFRDIVRRHIDLVFATALRKVGDTGGAQEISQNVFGALARKAWRFAPDDSLPAWLHKTTLLESKSWLRGELRRRRREQTAAELGTTMNTPDEQPAFNALVPLLDEALLSLRENDRTALLLRFYESQSMREVGTALGVSDDTAQKRVAGALEKLSSFFQRQGFKTATVAATAAALQQTAASASAATVSLVANVALQTAPPTLVGLGAWLARFVSLTKGQTAVVCLVLAAGPIAWQWNERNRTQTELVQVKNQLAAAQSEFSVRQTELLRWNETAARLDDSLFNTRQAADRRAETAQQFAAWKQQVRARLLAADYPWPEDLPFVRIPKTILPQLQVRRPVTPPGTIKQEARELLGLTPNEREQAEAALHHHFAAMDSLMEMNRFETNRTKLVSLPKDSLAGQVWGLPALGDEVKPRAEELQSALKTVLGDERWPLVAEQLESSGTDTLRRILNLDAGEKGQELAVWIQERNGNLVAGYSWGEPNSSSAHSGLALNLFLPDKEFPIRGASVEDYLGIKELPPALTGPALAWIRQQAEARLGKKGDR
jgi:RNA polymerase sigma factor (sigma-70 family)